MKIFEQMKAALDAQAPVGDEIEKVKSAQISMGTQKIPTESGPKHIEPRPFRIGDSVSYRTPVIKTATDYSWAWHHGILTEICERLELVIITPSDTPHKLISIPFVYVRAYEKNEINEFMEVGEHDQEGH